MKVPPIFYKSTNIVLHENHKRICSGQMVPTPKIYGIGSWTIMSAFCLIFLLFLHHVFIIVYFHNDKELRLRRSQGKVKRGLICTQILMKSRMRKLSPDFRKKANESLCFAKHKQKNFRTQFQVKFVFCRTISIKQLRRFQSP